MGGQLDRYNVVGGEVLEGSENSSSIRYFLWYTEVILMYPVLSTSHRLQVLFSLSMNLATSGMHVLLLL